MAKVGKGSKSSLNKKANSFPKTWNPAKDPVDRYARAALSRGSVHKGSIIRLDGAVTSLATYKTHKKAAATAAKRARQR